MIINLKESIWKVEKKKMCWWCPTHPLGWKWPTCPVDVVFRRFSYSAVLRALIFKPHFKHTWFLINLCKHTIMVLSEYEGSCSEWLRGLCPQFLLNFSSEIQWCFFSINNLIIGIWDDILGVNWVGRKELWRNWKERSRTPRQGQEG